MIISIKPPFFQLMGKTSKKYLLVKTFSAAYLTSLGVSKALLLQQLNSAAHCKYC